MIKRHFFTLRTALLLGAQLLWSTPSLATDYYVDANSGNNTYSGLTPNNGFADLEYAMGQLQAGDTLHVQSGEYHDAFYLNSEIYNNGTSDQPITIKAYQNETPVIGTGARIHIEGISWWVFEGLTFQNSAYLEFGIRDFTTATSQCLSTAENITIRGNRFHHGSEQGVSIICGRHLKIQNNIFDNLRSREAGKDLHAVSISYYANDIAITGNHFIDIGADGIQLIDGPGAEYTDIVIMGNEFEIQRPYRYRDENGHVVPRNQQPFDNVGENAIDIKQGPGPILISKNIIHGFRPTTIGQDASGAAGEGIIIHNQAHGITLSKNYFYDNQAHLAFWIGDNIDEQLDVDSLVHNNIFGELADPSTTGDKIPVGLGMGYVRNIKVFNNTFSSQYGDAIYLLRMGSANSVELFNNAFYNGRILVGDESQIDLVADRNAWGKVTTKNSPFVVYPNIIGANDIITDIAFIDPSTWEPLEGSPLIDAGLSLGLTEDFNSLPIIGIRPDIGAVEYQPGDKVLLADISIKQAGIPTRVIYPDDDFFEVIADIRNADPGNDYSFDWSQSDNSLTMVSGYHNQTLSIDPSGIAPGIYRVHIRVTNNVNPSQHNEVDTLLEISSVRPVLDAQRDSDGDGINDASEGSDDSDFDGIPDYLDAISDTSILQGMDGVSDRYLLITEPGLSLRLGSIAFTAGQQSAGVTLETIAAFGNGTGGPVINSEDTLAYSGGIYDFEVTGLSKAGQSVRVVLPLQAPIAAGATFRKYHPAYGWQDFILNEYNSLASAPGSNGSCPAPGDEAYRPGLRTGHYCIQLTLEDGGPNDVDGLRNGRIQDPGGAGVAPQSLSNKNIDSSAGDGSGGGGCAISGHRTFDPLLILLLIISTVGLYRRRTLH